MLNPENSCKDSGAELTPSAFQPEHVLSSYRPNTNSIAIVGMSVELPGALDAQGLWAVLEQGMNTIEQVGVPLQTVRKVLPRVLIT